MKKCLLLLLTFLFVKYSNAQVVNGPQGYRVIDIGDNGQGDFTRSLILLHEAYNGQLLAFNNAVGTITAHRGHQGAFTRINVGYIYSTSSYDGIVGSIESISNESPWKLKTCIYLGKKYLALEVPYSAAYHNWGFQFAGWTNSSGENMKCVNYMVNNQPVNQDVLSGIQDFVSNMSQVNSAKEMSFKGHVNVGTEVSDPEYLLRVKGKIRAEEIKVAVDNWPDYVFSKSYQLPDLLETAVFIEKNGHLPAVPSAEEVKEKGVNVGDMNAILLKKIEELTLQMIELKKENIRQQKQIQKGKNDIMILNRRIK